MGLRHLKIDRFRCLTAVDFEPHPKQNVIVGANGAGKTSVLESVFYLGRGHSFRPGPSSTLIQRGAEEFTVFGEIQEQDERRRVGAQFGRQGIRIHVNGEPGGAKAELVAAFPVQVIDPQVHELVQGGPKGRRHFIDWGVFHVKHEFLPVWRRYRRALQQRNTALRQGLPRQGIEAWESELIGAGTLIDEYRRTYLARFQAEFEAVSLELLGLVAKCSYRPGWAQDLDFKSALAGARERDVAHGQTQVGPHRAELALEVDGIPARHRLSRGQQKLLGISLVLAQSRFVANEINRDIALLVDEPAAELDADRLAVLIGVLSKTRAQLFITALKPDALPIDSETRLFHVEHGVLSTLL